MEKLVITGPTPLKGEVNISGAKNSASDTSCNFIN